MLTKLQYRTMIRQYLDDPVGKRWADANLDLATQLVIDDLWTDILDTNGYITSQLQTLVSLHSPGYIDKRLVADGGDLTKRLYRIQMIKNADSVFYRKDQRDFFLGAADLTSIATAPFTYEVKGDQIWLYGQAGAFGTQPIDIRYAFKPVAFTASLDGDSIQFPDGCESAIIYATAAAAMAKGNAEEAAQLTNLADRSYQRLLAAVRRDSRGPMVPYTSQSSEEFGSI